MAGNILLLEGPKRAGKTSLAQFLQRKGFSYFKDNTYYAIKDRDSDLQRHILERNLLILENFLDKIPGVMNIIIDRHHLTDFVYSMVYRQTPKAEAEKEFYKRDFEMASKGAILITMTDEPENLLEREKESSNGGFVPTIEHTRRVVDKFNIAHNSSSMIKYTLNLSSEDFKKNLSSILLLHFGLKIDESEVII